MSLRRVRGKHGSTGEFSPILPVYSVLIFVSVFHTQLSFEGWTQNPLQRPQTFRNIPQYKKQI